MKANRKQNVVKLTASEIVTHALLQVVTKYGKCCLHQVVELATVFFYFLGMNLLVQESCMLHIFCRKYISMSVETIIT